MTSDVFIDASAIVAILLQEDDRQRLTAAMMAAERRFTSAVALYETAVTLARRWKGDMNGANKQLTGFAERAGLEILAVDERTDALAREAFRRFGKGRAHPAQVNLGDCFAYACVKQHDSRFSTRGTTSPKRISSRHFVPVPDGKDT